VHLWETSNLVKKAWNRLEQNCEPLSVKINSGTPKVKKTWICKKSHILLEENFFRELRNWNFGLYSTILNKPMLPALDLKFDFNKSMYRF